MGNPSGVPVAQTTPPTETALKPKPAPSVHALRVTTESDPNGCRKFVANGAEELATLGRRGVEVLSLKLRKSAGMRPFCNSGGHELLALQKNGGQKLRRWRRKISKAMLTFFRKVAAFRLVPARISRSPEGMKRTRSAVEIEPLLRIRVGATPSSGGRNHVAYT